MNLIHVIRPKFDWIPFEAGWIPLRRDEWQNREKILVLPAIRKLASPL